MLTGTNAYPLFPRKIGGLKLNYKKTNKNKDFNKEFIQTIKTITPDLINVLETRYEILRIINYLQPIGRRSLSNKICLSERNVRTEANLLKEQGLIDITPEGMNITSLGKNTIDSLKSVFHSLKGFNELERRVERITKIKKVIIVPGLANEDSLVFREIGKAAAAYLNKILHNGNVVGLTGGTTIARLVQEYPINEKHNLQDTIIVPARGGLGKKVEYQANTLAEKLANKISCNYRDLYIPDFLSKNTIDSLRNEPSIKEIVDLVRNLDILVFGVGRADIMAKRRGLVDADIESLIKKGAVSEAFGYYFNETGNIVHEISTIGIDLDKFKEMENLIAVAGGSEKTEAIVSIMKLNKNLVLITDEGVAKKIISKYKEEE